jgi:integrase/recombinase XerD
VDWLKDPLVAAYLADCRIRGMSPRSFPGCNSALRAYLQYLSHREASIIGVGQEDLIGFIEYLRFERKSAQRTIELTFSVLSSLYDFLVFKGHAEKNPILPIRKRYLKAYKDCNPGHERQLISVEAMAGMINSTMDIRDKAIITLLAKTGIRRNELISLDLADVDIAELRIRLKPTAKRSNRLVFFDGEAAFVLRQWLKVREGLNKKRTSALFLNHEGDRLQRRGVSDAVTSAAKRTGLHNPGSERLEDHFSPHNCRHWNTTHLLRAGMKREYVQWLRGDAIKEAVDIYFHIDPKDVQEAYLAAIPQLGI